jgi:hypothetical protein
MTVVMPTSAFTTVVECPVVVDSAAPHSKPPRNGAGATTGSWDDSAGTGTAVALSLENRYAAGVARLGQTNDRKAGGDGRQAAYSGCL